MITYMLEELRNECDYDCMYCDSLLREYCYEKVHEERKELEKIKS